MIQFSSLLFGCCSVDGTTNMLSLSGYNAVCVLLFRKLLTLISEQIAGYCELKWLNELRKLLLCFCQVVPWYCVAHRTLFNFIPFDFKEIPGISSGF